MSKMRIGLVMGSIVVLGVLGVGCAAQVGEPDEGVGSVSAAASLPPPPPPPPTEDTNCDDDDHASDNGEMNKGHRDGPQGEHGHERVCKNKNKNK